MSDYLRVVKPGDLTQSGKLREHHVPEHGGQFRFNFEIEPVRRIVLIPMDEIHGKSLHDLIVELTPVAALDLRYAVRFDLPGTNRHRFFGDLQLAHTNYIREPVEWHNVEGGPLAVDAKILPHRLFHEVVEREVGHIIVLVPNKRNVGIVASALNLALTKRRTHGWRIEQAA